VSARIEKLLKDYPEMVRERSFVAHQIANFQGVTAEEVIESMYTIRVDGTKVRTSGTSDKTAQIALNYKDKMERLNREWLEQLEIKLRCLNDELALFDAALNALTGVLPDFTRDLIVNSLTWDSLQSKYNISRSTVGAYRKKALAELEKLYSAYERDAVDFMLQ